MKRTTSKNSKIVKVTVRRTKYARAEAIRKAKNYNPAWTVLTAQKEEPFDVTYKVMMRKRKK